MEGADGIKSGVVLDCQQLDVKQQGVDGEEEAVEAVEEAAVAGKGSSGVFYGERAFDEGFDEVAQGGENGDGYGEADPVVKGDNLFKMSENEGDGYG